MAHPALAVVRRVPLAVALLASSVASAAGQTLVAGRVHGTWGPAGNPYVLTGDTYVAGPDALVLEAGVEVLGARGVRLEARDGGRLEVRGSLTAPVTLSALDPATGWRGLRLLAASDASVLRHCVIERAIGRSEDPEEVRGGALAVVRCSPLVEDCELRYSEVHNANSNGVGGGLYVAEGSGVFRRNHIHHNSADVGGGIAVVHVGSPQVGSNLVTDNVAGTGGGVYAGAWTHPVLEANRILRNRATGELGGGGVTSWGPVEAPAWREMRHNVIAFNRADSVAGGVLMRYDGCRSTHDLVVGNEAPVGAGICVLNQGTYAPELRGVIVWGNRGAQVARWPGLPVGLTVSHSLVQGGWPGVGNLDADPRFMDPVGPDGVPSSDDADFRLGAGSPCIDAAGHGALAPGTTDANGEPRFVDDRCTPGAGPGALPDLGPFERQTASCCPDPARACTAAPNSAGAGAWMGWLGSASLAGRDLVLTTTGCPSGQLGLFLYGLGGATAPVALGGGWSCVPAPARRLGSFVVTDVRGRVRRALDAQAEIGAALPGGQLAGQTVCFQLWYRDPAGAGGASNLSDALAITFCP